MQPHTLSRLLQSASFSVICGTLLAAVWATFTYVHVVAFQKLGEPRLLLLLIAETLAAGFYVLRSHPRSVSLVPFDWAVAFAGTFFPMLLRPADWAALPSAGILMAVGLGIQILAIMSLNRSFALVPATRIIKTEWTYRFVRHPIYASYLLTLTGYLLLNTTLWNGLVYTAAIALLLIRIVREEKFLSADDVYRQYKLRVRYRLVPYVF
jgi:protein-S-isoprenylcysteine O-methyltransferase Ste14